MTTSESIKIFGKIRQNFPQMRGFFCKPSENKFSVYCEHNPESYKQQIQTFKNSRVVNGVTIIFNHCDGCMIETIEKVEL